MRILIAATLLVALIDPQVSIAADPPAKEPVAVGRDGAAAAVDAPAFIASAEGQTLAGQFGQAVVRP